MKYAKINTETTYDLTGERKGDMGMIFTFLKIGMEENRISFVSVNKLRLI